MTTTTRKAVVSVEEILSGRRPADAKADPKADAKETAPKPKVEALLDPKAWWGGTPQYC